MTQERFAAALVFFAIREKSNRWSVGLKTTLALCCFKAKESEIY